MVQIVVEYPLITLSIRPHVSQFQGDDCGINDFQSSNNSNTRFSVRQTGEEFRSEAPPDCRIVVCGTDGTVPATITTTVAPTTISTITTPVPPIPTAVPQTPTSDEPENLLIPFDIRDVMALKPEEIVEESIFQPEQSTSDILNNIDDSDSDNNENDTDDIRVTSEIVPIYVRPILNQAFYNPTYYRDKK